MPWWSKYKLLLADDDELADAARGAGVPAPAQSSRPRLAEWNPAKEIIAEIRDATARIEAVVANSAPRAKKGRTVKPKPTARPLTAAQRSERRAEIDQHHDIVRRVLPKG